MPPFYMTYVKLVKDGDLLQTLNDSGKLTLQLIRSIPEPKGEFRYQPEKWSIKELLCHMIDAERIFAYRALRFSRNDKTPLSGFEEKDYALEANAHNRTIETIANEMEHVRLCSIDLYTSFSTEMLSRTGKANNTEISVLNLGYIISGHETHHRNVLLERYLKV
ncbi:MAG TPA: DinB family protein [Chryseolinea sp.]|nr:DinB family protein [Chryseolinea sp.]HPM28875.1 DinB family protein [Chryseolinea sp.]